MGSSRNSNSGELPERAAAALAPAIFPGTHLALGLSGGVDSVALLSALTELAPAMRFSLRAVHVNHGISPNATRWAEFCAQLCARFRIPFQLERNPKPRAQSGAKLRPARGVGADAVIDVHGAQRELERRRQLEQDGKQGYRVEAAREAQCEVRSRKNPRHKRRRHPFGQFT